MNTAILKVFDNLFRAEATRLAGHAVEPPAPPRQPTGYEWVSLGSGIGWWEPY